MATTMRGLQRESASADDDPARALRDSWTLNAAAWTTVVRAHGIPSRRAGTDAAVLAACDAALTAARGRRVLDAGCGEGWLARALAARGADVVGVDASPALVQRAADGPTAGGPAAEGHAPVFVVASYAELGADRTRAPGPFDVVVCNFALLDDALDVTLGALAARLAPCGQLVIQTVHPWAASADDPYEDGWRIERFAAFDAHFPAAMPWYFRTLGSWVTAARDAGLHLTHIDEPLHPDTRRPLSVILRLALAAR